MEPGCFVDGTLAWTRHGQGKDGGSIRRWKRPVRLLNWESNVSAAPNTFYIMGFHVLFFLAHWLERAGRRRTREEARGELGLVFSCFGV